MTDVVNDRALIEMAPERLRAPSSHLHDMRQETQEHLRYLTSYERAGEHIVLFFLDVLVDDSCDQREKVAATLRKIVGGAMHRIDRCLMLDFLVIHAVVRDGE